MPKPISDLPESEVIPAAVLEKRARRKFSIEYKLQILAQADACAHGELSALLRREQLYSSQVRQWRRDLARQGVDGLSKSAPGPKAAMSAEQRRIAELEKRNAQLTHKLELAEDCLELQKKALSILDRMNTGNDA